MKEYEKKVVRIHDVDVDKEYVKWINEIKARYRSSQIKAAIRINSEQLRFNWMLGRDLVLRKAEEKWGSGIVEQVSLDLQAAFPESKGFGAANIWRMKQWYRFFSPEKEKLQQVVGELQGGKLAQLVRELQQPEKQHNIKHHQLGGELPEVLSLVPWGHHIIIITRCQSIEEAIFYIKRTISDGWSRSTLINCIKSDLYHTSGGAITNFADQLPYPQRELAQAITKETYDFGFLTLKEGYKEESLETELEKHLTRFLLELGSGFAYMGRQKQIVVGDKTRKLDMLFFHINLNCYIVVELKAVPFQPEFTGKLNYYVNLVDDLIKTPAQNPTIGLLICSDKESTEVQYAIKGIQTPIGVSSFENVHIKEIQEQLPTVEELRERIRQIEEDMHRE
ncbi:MAG: DUF1016 family protein [Bacteroidales bacterium]|nr:DUF1016 family protein [Bacteroidales bacterium]